MIFRDGVHNVFEFVRYLSKDCNITSKISDFRLQIVRVLDGLFDDVIIRIGVTPSLNEHDFEVLKGYQDARSLCIEGLLIDEYEEVSRMINESGLWGKRDEFRGDMATIILRHLLPAFNYLQALPNHRLQHFTTEQRDGQIKRVFRDSPATAVLAAVKTAVRQSNNGKVRTHAQLIDSVVAIADQQGIFAGSEEEGDAESHQQEEGGEDV